MEVWTGQDGNDGECGGTPFSKRVSGSVKSVVRLK